MVQSDDVPYRDKGGGLLPDDFVVYRNGGVVDRPTLDGPLLTASFPDTDRERLQARSAASRPAKGRGLARPLGTVTPTRDGSGG
ncbi:hypothetical protein ACWD4J_07610 [Streptomyces sp. NPDC002577]